MSKDTIFSNKPKEKVFKTYASCTARPYVNRGRSCTLSEIGKNSRFADSTSYLEVYKNSRCYPNYIIIKESQINLKDYRKVGKNEILLKDDIYFCPTRDGWVYTQLVGQAPMPMVTKRTYYRKLSFNQPPYIDITQYKLLCPSELIQEGDEFYNKGKWFKSGNFYKTAGEIYFYRRKLKSL